MLRPTNPVNFMWLEITGKCQLECDHCYADSGPQGDHGTMSLEDWIQVLNHAAILGVGMVQFIGGEPTMHPHLPELIDYALLVGLEVEVYTNLVSVSDEQWQRFRKPGVRLATSFYSADRDQHEAIVRRDTLRQTQRNIERAVTDKITIRVGRVDVLDNQDNEGAAKWLTDLGIDVDPYVDIVRGVGRGTLTEPNVDALCGNCTSGVLAVNPTGLVWPCVFSRFMPIGNVKATSLIEIVNGTKLTKVRDRLNKAFDARHPIPPTDGCNPYDDSICTPALCNPEKCRPAIGNVAAEGQEAATDGCHPLCEPNSNCSPVCVPSCWPSHHTEHIAEGSCEPFCSPSFKCGPTCDPSCAPKHHHAEGACKPNNGCEPSTTGCSPSCHPSCWPSHHEGVENVCLMDPNCHPNAPCGPQCSPSTCEPKNQPKGMHAVSHKSGDCTPITPCSPSCRPANCDPRTDVVAATPNRCDPLCAPNNSCKPWSSCFPTRSTQDELVVNAVCEPLQTCNPYDNGCYPGRQAHESTCYPDLCGPEKGCAPTRCGPAAHDSEEHILKDCTPLECGPRSGCSPWCSPSWCDPAKSTGEVVRPCIPTNCAPQNHCEPSKKELVPATTPTAGVRCEPTCKPFAGCKPWNPCKPES